MDILILYESGVITYRTYQICKTSGLYTIESLKSYLSINGDFLSLETSTKKTNIELLDLLAPLDNYSLEVFESETTLTSLYEKGLITFDLLDFCHNNKFFIINDLKQYLTTSSDFTSLNNCGFTTNYDLLKIVAFEKITASKSKQLSMFDGSDLNMLDSNQMSVRAYNVCIDNSLKTIEDLYDYYKTHGSFLSLLKCGSKTNEELINLIEFKSFKPLDNVFDSSIDLNSHKEKLWLISSERMLFIVNSLTKRDRNSINCFINLLLISISNQTLEILSTYYERDFRIKNILKKGKLINEVGKVKGIIVGSKYHKEILFFYEQVFKNIILMKDSSVEAKQQFLEVLADKSKVGKEVLKHIDLQYCSGLKTIDFLIRNGLIFGDRTEINLKCLNIYDNFKPATLEEVGEVFKVTRERIRQIRLRGLKELDSILKNLTHFFSDDLYVNWSYDEYELITVSESLISQINRANDVRFSKEFLIYLFSIASDRHSIIPEIEIGLLAKLNNKSIGDFNNFYLISRDQFQKLDFITMISDIKTRKNEKIDETYSLSFDNYLSRFMHINTDLDNELIDISEEIIMQETAVFINSYNEIEFQRNVIKTVPDYAYEILKEIGEPAKIDFMYKRLLEKYPDFDRAENTFKACFNLDSRFVPIGRQSIWGLKEWEDEREDFLGGSMLEIAENILQKSEVPMHISEIADEVSKYRDIDDARLMNNLRFNNRRGFTFFSKQYVGLKSKEYKDDDFKLLNNEQRTWEESYSKLKDFIARNNRLPRAKDNDDESARLYRWYGIQKRRYSDEKLGPKRLEKMERIISDFDSWSMYE